MRERVHEPQKTLMAVIVSQTTEGMNRTTWTKILIFFNHIQILTITEVEIINLFM